MYLQRIYAKEIMAENSYVDSTKATGPFSVSIIDVLKFFKEIILKPLEIIFDSSLLNGIVLDSF